MTPFTQNRRPLRLRLPILAVLFFVLGRIFAHGAMHVTLNVLGVVTICTAIVWLFVDRMRPQTGA